MSAKVVSAAGFIRAMSPPIRTSGWPSPRSAHRAGIRRVIIPERNVKDLIDVPEEVKKEMEILSVKRMDEVLAIALKDPPPSIIDLAKAA